MKNEMNLKDLYEVVADLKFKQFKRAEVARELVKNENESPEFLKAVGSYEALAEVLSLISTELKKQGKRICAECGEEFNENGGRSYKYEPTLWLCDDHYSEWMERE